MMQLDCHLEFKHQPKYMESAIPMHRHRWRIRVAIDLPDTPADEVSYSAVFARISPILKRYDRELMNTVHPFDKVQPTHDNIARYLFNAIDDGVRKLGVRLSTITIWEDLELINQVGQRSPEFDDLNPVPEPGAAPKPPDPAWEHTAKNRLAALLFNITPPL